MRNSDSKRIIDQCLQALNRLDISKSEYRDVLEQFIQDAEMRLDAVRNELDVAGNEDE